MSKIIIPKAYQDLFFFLQDRKHPPYRYFDYPGGRSSGKSTTVALALVLECSQFETRVLCTREFQNSIAESVKQLLADIIKKYELPGFTILKDIITHKNGSVIWFKGLHEDPESTLKGIEGVDRCWIEEAQFITDHSLDVLLPTIRKNGSTIIFTRNPLTPDDAITRRFVTNPSELTSQRTVSHHTTYRDALEAGILPEEILTQVEESKNNPDYLHIWEGQPVSQATNVLIDWKLLDEATRRTPQTEGAFSFGIDVARYGNDRTAVAIVQGLHLVDVVSWRKTSITASADKIQTLFTKYNPTNIKIDDTGLGGGLTDILKTNHLPITPINYAQKPKQPNLYPKTADELWFDFANQLTNISINPHIRDLPELKQELTTREWHITSRNQREIQKKQDYKQTRQTGSPDLADAVLLAYYQPAIMPAWNVTV